MNWSGPDATDVPPGVVTRTSTVAAGPAGEVTVQEVTVGQEMEVPGLAPKAAVVTRGPITKPDPVTVTTVPPVRGPEAGDTAVTAGATS